MTTKNRSPPLVFSFQSLSTSQTYLNDCCHTNIPFSSSAKNLGFYFTDSMNVELHVTNTCRNAYIELRRIGSLRHVLSVEATKTLVSALVISKLDYCNALLSGCPKDQLDKLQRVQNSAARLVFRSRKRDHVSPLLKRLHWLPVKARIEFKLALLCHSFFSGTAPHYISQLLSIYTPSRNLRSSSDLRLLRVPRVRTKSFGHCSFSYSAPTFWNSLPYEIRHIQSVSSFKTALKTHQFKSYFSD